ncbi:DNA-binding NarL/FixJ family response regulator [Streptomyces puniciscabiei]|uniref:DNA-binding NarL/FixJ family response regulator n=1 Tax=Streptomyces puniciscabiei TaxID=164348 RepID=A0A542U8A1_9ACTN|nr:response regulator transcription factor [Streptomyces puniciscabiei]TQK95278.1 DNA-binding NarL/FixJ family response regulator [Streptomyces puniciscabiei]
MTNTTEADCIRVLICDPRHLMRAGMVSVLEREPDISVVGEALDGREMLTAVQSLRPHVALINHDADAVDGIAMARRLRRTAPDNAPGVLMLSSRTEQAELLSALKGGVRGLLPGNCDPRTLPAAIRDIAGGAMVLKSPNAVQLIGRLLNRSPEVAASAGSGQLALLTTRERDVLSLVANGHSNLVIAKMLSLSEATVKSHLYHLCQKLGLRDRTQAVILAYETGLVRPCAA